MKCLLVLALCLGITVAMPLGAKKRSHHLERILKSLDNRLHGRFFPDPPPPPPPLPPKPELPDLPKSKLPKPPPCLECEALHALVDLEPEDWEKEYKDENEAEIRNQLNDLKTCIDTDDCANLNAKLDEEEKQFLKDFPITEQCINRYAYRELSKLVKSEPRPEKPALTCKEDPKIVVTHLVTELAEIIKQELEEAADVIKDIVKPDEEENTTEEGTGTTVAPDERKLDAEFKRELLTALKKLRIMRSKH